ncbi:DUF3293 domain-containing protein [Arenimonas caeni]|jgi:hypothetical protein|uniref:DUF3293 domain-containing protein n=1 Tax=Arenimonas caeni TaxID=2058085 RepID=UPI002A371FF8|nr:DUF3293 domain-containing protein [Arenimonas caeni]MDY0022132.1 DUF3293 domain-containing protein [Arenimonas caeni]
MQMHATYPPPPAMMASFADAVYRVYDQGRRIDLRIGQPNPDMAALLARFSASHGGLVTGENPFGQQQSAEANAAANAELAAAIDALGLPRLPSDGGSEDGAWNEPGFLVVGGEGQPVDALARRFRQAAWVRIEADGSAHLAGCEYPLASSGLEPCWPPQVFPGPAGGTGPQPA